MIITAPESIQVYGDYKTIFLAGSIENGKAIDWQSKLSTELNCPGLRILNPRRRVWSSEEAQSIDNLDLKEQVNWELDGITQSDLVIFFFSKDTISPVTMLEFGLCVGSGIPMIVFCEEGFHRKGNIDITADKFGVPMAESFDEIVTFVKCKFYSFVKWR